MIALVAIVVTASFVLLKPDDAETHLSRNIASMPKDLAQIIELHQIYANPPLPEDPAHYPKASSVSAGARSPDAKRQP